MHLEWNVIRLVYVYWTRYVITELFVFIELQQKYGMFLCGQCHLKKEQHSMHSGVELRQWVYWMVPTSVHKCERKEKFACTGIFGSRIFYKHLQWRVDEAEWKCKKNSKGRKKYQVLKRYNIHTGIIIIIIYSLCICHSRNFSSCKQGSENCRYIFNFH